jgi:hypothetical protein
MIQIVKDWYANETAAGFLKNNVETNQEKAWTSPIFYLMFN